MGVAYEVELRESFDFALREAGAYFMKEGRSHESLHRLAARLEEEGIGYVRMTENADVLLTAEGLRQFREGLVGGGYIATDPGATRAFRDTESGVRIEILVTGEFPGDGRYRRNPARTSSRRPIRRRATLLAESSLLGKAESELFRVAERTRQPERATG
jgi:hypothetical protein